jgi:hypothetical protein
METYSSPCYGCALEHAEENRDHGADEDGRGPVARKVEECDEHGDEQGRKRDIDEDVCHCHQPRQQGLRQYAAKHVRGMRSASTMPWTIGYRNGGMSAEVDMVQIVARAKHRRSCRASCR